MRILNVFLLIGFFLGFGTGCTDEKPGGNPLDKSKLIGTGVFTYPITADTSGPKMNVFYHIPSNAHTTSPILLVFHGNGRDAEYSRNLLVKEAENKGVIIVCPEFSSKLFPGSNEYQLGGMFKDGENAKLSEMRPKGEWTFSLIDKMFISIKTTINSEVSYYDMFGHSAGGQFVHRFITFMPNSLVRKAVSAASGWYTVPLVNIDFPYGLGQTGVNESNFEDVFSKSVLVSVGSKDTDPNSSALRHDTQSDLQGSNRVERAKFYFTECQKQAGKFGLVLNWKLTENPGIEHDFMGNAKAALKWLYP
jgi:hypothetical protein